MYNLFLDDQRKPKDVTWVELPPVQWHIARNFDEFVSMVQRLGIPARVSFDHDLADEHYRPSMYNPDGHYGNYYSDGTFKERTGYHCALWLAEACAQANVPFPEAYVHTMNPIGRVYLEGVIEGARRFWSQKT